jgi:bisphosphoglycerate-dependent phosphoglycerate mutase
MNLYNKINQKLKEHYGIEVATDSARKITEYHAEQIKLIEKEFINNPNKAKELLIAELDGGMVPIVEYLDNPLTLKGTIINTIKRRIKYYNK